MKREECLLFFEENVAEYLKLWNLGLKKKANQIIKEAMEQFDGWSKEHKKEVVLEFCAQVCDTEDSPFRQVFGRVPYELSTRIKDILYDCCEEMGMPCLRWCYELCGHDGDILRKAYCHPGCDEKTVCYYFKAFLDDLWYGAHHFPDGCLITEADFDKTVDCCERILEEHTVSQDLKAEYEYYKRLYQIWWEVKGTGNGRNFLEQCEKEELGFVPVEAIYYEK